MKFSKTSQLVLASLVSLGAASLLVGCQLVTIDYVFVANSAGTASGSAEFACCRTTSLRIAMRDRLAPTPS